jgi:hypothetical protein
MRIIGQISRRLKINPLSQGFLPALPQTERLGRLSALALFDFPAI